MGNLLATAAVIGGVIRESENPLRSIIAAALLVLCSQIGGCNRTDSKVLFSAHSKSALPQSAKLVHSGGQYAGFDASYGFVFDVTDDTLQDQLVNEWKLESSSATGSGFFQFAKHNWWPTDAEFAKMEASFSRENKQNEEYWHVWCDQSNRRLYVEHGRW